MAANGQKTIGKWPGFCCLICSVVFFLMSYFTERQKQQSCANCNYQERPLMSNMEAAKVHTVCSV